MAERGPGGWTEWVDGVDRACHREWFEGWRAIPDASGEERLLSAAIIRWAVTGDEEPAAAVSRWLPGLVLLTDQRVHLALALADWAEREAFDYGRVLDAQECDGTIIITTQLSDGREQRDLFRLEPAFADHQPDSARTLVHLLQSGGDARTCTNCDQYIGAEERYCRHCGQQQALHCAGCGEQVSPRDRFCGSCGERLERS